MSTLTIAYTDVHEALAVTASEAGRGLTPADVRVLLALHERGGVADTLDLQIDFGGGDYTSVRRSLVILYRRELCRPVVPTKRGVRSIIELTETGAAIAASCVAEHQFRVADREEGTA